MSAPQTIAAGVGVFACANCSLLHVAMVDLKGEVIAMTLLDRADALRFVASAQAAIAQLDRQMQARSLDCAGTA